MTQPYLYRDNVSFIHFSELPMEIRLRIWSLALDAVEPRIVRANSLKPIEHSGSKNNPSLLFVNRESRKETLRRYELSSRMDWTYIDFARDTLFADHYLSRDTIWSDPRYDSRIRSLALDLTLAGVRKEALFTKIKRSPKLQKLIIVPNPSWHGIGSAVIIEFTEIDRKHFSKFCYWEVQLVRRLQEYGTWCIKEGLRAGLDVCVAGISCPIRALDGSASDSIGQ